MCNFLFPSHMMIFSLFFHPSLLTNSLSLAFTASQLFHSSSDFSGKLTSFHEHELLAIPLALTQSKEAHGTFLSRFGNSLEERERRPTTTGRGLVRRWRSDSTISSLPSVVRSVPFLFFRLSRPCHEEDTLQRREEVNEEVRECSVEGVGHVGRAEHRTLCSEEEEEDVCAD